MSKIRVDISGLADLRQHAGRVEHSMEEIAAQIASANRSLDMNTAGSGHIRDRLENLQRQTCRQQRIMKQYADVLARAGDWFTDSDHRIAYQAREINYLMDQILVTESAPRQTKNKLEIIEKVAGIMGMIGWIMPGMGMPDLMRPVAMEMLVDKAVGTGISVANRAHDAGYIDSKWSGPCSETEIDKDGIKHTVYRGRGHRDLDAAGMEGDMDVYIGKTESELSGTFFQWSGEKSGKSGGGKYKEDSDHEFTFLEIKAETNGSAISNETTATMGDNQLGVDPSVSGSTGNIRLGVSSKAAVSKGGMDAYVDGKAMVTATEGTGSATFNIAGLEITLKASGYGGALGVEGKAGVEDNKFVAEGGAALGVGGKFGVEIGLNDDGKKFMADDGDQLAQSFMHGLDNWFRPKPKAGIDTAAAEEFLNQGNRVLGEIKQKDTEKKDMSDFLSI